MDLCGAVIEEKITLDNGENIYTAVLGNEIEWVKPIKKITRDTEGWITDRVPTKEECGKYGKNFLVTVKEGFIPTIDLMRYEYVEVNGKEVSRWKWRGRNPSPWEVIAWKALPRPYNESVD